MKRPKLLLAIASAILFSCDILVAQRLTAELCSAKLPTARIRMAPVYDGDDSIYLFGGYGAEYYNETLKYSIVEDRMEIVAHLPFTIAGGTAVMNKFRNIFFFNGWNSPDIYQYLPASQTFELVSRFQTSMVGRDLMKPDMDTALIVVHWRSTLTVTSLNLNTLESETIGSHATPYVADFLEAVWSEVNGLAYIFTTNDTLTYSRAHNQFASLGKQLPFPYHRDGVSDGRYIYLFGQMDNEKGIILFDPEDETMRYIPVENKPQLSSLAPVYVVKLNRIYTFGGQEEHGTNKLVEDIYYIDLDPMNETPPTTENAPIPTMDPDIFNCMGRPDAVYPYPGDCSQFVICREGHGYPFNCPVPLLFHAINRQCTWPDWVDCR